MIWMITGLHEHRWLNSVVSNYARQTHASKGLVIVENGKGLGCAADCVGLPGVVVLQSEPGPAQPLNVALDWLRAKGEGHLTRINDILFNLMEAERRIEAGR